jgi:chromosome partitioning protein
MSKKRKAPIISVLNMKGGVGKTTISGNLFREVFRTKNIHTLLVDIDPQFNLTQLLMTREKYDKILDKNKTILNVFQHDLPDSVFAVSEEYNLKMPETDSITTRLKYLRNTNDGEEENNNTELRLLAGNFELAELNLKGSNELSIPRKRFKLFIEQARDDYQLVIIDCNPSTSFLTKCAIEVSSHILVPVRPDKYSVLGVEMISHFIKKYLGTGLEPDMKILLNDCSTEVEPQKIIREIRAHPTFGPLVMVNELPHSKLLRAKPDYTGFAVDQRVPYKDTIRRKLVAIADEYSDYLGIK